MLRLNQFFILLQNAQHSHKESICVPFSKHIWECAQALAQFGVLQSVTFLKNPSNSYGYIQSFDGRNQTYPFLPYRNQERRPYFPEPFSDFQTGLVDENIDIPHQAYTSSPRIQKRQKHRNRLPQIHCVLKYSNQIPVIQTIQLLSTPGSKVAWRFSQVVHECSRPGHLLFLTKYGILTEAETLKAEVGGLPLCRLFLHNWKQ